MRVLLIANKVLDDGLGSYHDVQSFFLSKGLIEKDVEVFFLSPSTEIGYEKKILAVAKKYEVNSIVALGNNFFGKFGFDRTKIISESFKGIVAQISDMGVLDDFAADVNFYLVETEWKYLDNKNNRLLRHRQYNKYIGWAASDLIFYPRDIVDDEVLNIFVDHSCFNYIDTDLSLNIFMGLREFKKNLQERQHENFKDIVVKTLTDQGIVEINLNSIEVRPFKQSPIQQNKIAEELGRSHVFFVTHKESMGLMALEAALSGCYIVSQKSLLEKGVSDNLRISMYDRVINFEDILINAKKRNENAQYVKKFTWESCIDRLIGFLGALDKRKFD